MLGLIGGPALDDRANRGRNLFGQDLGRRPGAPALHEFRIEDALDFLAPGELGRVAFEEIGRDRGERVHLPPLRLGLLACFLDLRVDPLADQLQPAARLLAGIIEREGPVVAERAARRVVGMRGIAAAQREALVAAIGDAQHQPRHDRVRIVDPLAGGRRLARLDEPVGQGPI